MYRSSAPTLTCPQCSVGLARVEGDVALYACERCGGAWIDAESSVGVLQGKTDPSAALRPSTPPAPKTGPEVPRPCARCSETMLPYPFGDVMLDTCPAHGTWFDRDEITRVVAAARKMETAKPLELPSADAVWQTAKFTAGMLMMPLGVLANVLAILVRDGVEAFYPDD